MNVRQITPSWLACQVADVAITAAISAIFTGSLAERWRACVSRLHSPDQDLKADTPGVPITGDPGGPVLVAENPRTGPVPWQAALSALVARGPLD